MAKLTAACRIGTNYVTFEAMLDADVDADKPDEVRAKAARLFAQVQQTAERALEKYRVESAGAYEKQLAEVEGRRQTPHETDEELGRCVDCGKRIFSAKVVEYARAQFGKAVCYECQMIRKNGGTPTGSNGNEF